MTRRGEVIASSLALGLYFSCLVPHCLHMREKMSVPFRALSLVRSHSYISGIFSASLIELYFEGEGGKIKGNLPPMHVPVPPSK